MINETAIALSRIQFGMTAMYHFLFVPLTLGLSVMLGIMETVYVITKKPIWRDIVKFWGILFGINFAMGVATGITMEFQFGTNWSYYSQYVGDIFGAPLAIEGLMAFFLEATFIGIFFFGWERLSPVKHLIVTWMVALGSSLSALWILVANGWMQHPVGSYFDFHTMRMEVSDFASVILNPVAQAKFVHTISAGYVTGAVFVLAISAYYLLRGRNVEIAKRSMTVAAAFGLAAALSVIVLGDESGYMANDHQKMKMAAIEGLWNTEAAPASFNLFGVPNYEERTTNYRVKIPYVLGLIATRSTSEPVYGINDLVKRAQDTYIPKGMLAYKALKVLYKNPNSLAAKKLLAENSQYLGYGLLLKKYTTNVSSATKTQIQQAAWDTVPKHLFALFWSFRVMVALGFFFIILFSMGAFLALKRRLQSARWFLLTALFSLPLPWIAAELGWFVAENGRQPWIIQGVLPTSMGVSSLAPSSLWISLIGFVFFYTVLAIVELFLMTKYIRLGPDGLKRKAQDLSTEKVG